MTTSSARWLAPALLAICFLGSPPARAAEPSGSPEIAAAAALPTQSGEVAAAARERSRLSTPDAAQALTADAPRATTEEPAKLDRPPVRLRRIARRDERLARRDEERPQRFRREAAAIPWHRSGVGLILGVGF
jgi:hypothetical protein